MAGHQAALRHPFTMILLRMCRSKEEEEEAWLATRQPYVILLLYNDPVGHVQEQGGGGGVAGHQAALRHPGCGRGEVHRP